MKRNIPIARSVVNAFGVNEVYQDNLLNLFAERPAPRQQHEFDLDLTITLRTVPGERQLIADSDLTMDGERLDILGCYWMEHHNVGTFNNRLLVCSNKGVHMFAPKQNSHRFAPLDNSFKAWPGGDLAGQVHIVSNGFSWVISSQSGRGFVYMPERLQPHEHDYVPADTETTPNTRNETPFGAVLREFTTVAAFRQMSGVVVPDEVDGVGSDDGLSPVALDKWWNGRKQQRYNANGDVTSTTGTYDWPHALAEFEGGAIFGRVIFHGGRYIAQERNSGRFYWSGLAGSNYQHIFLPIDYATAASDGDPMVSLISNRKLFYPLGTRTAEVWYSNVQGRLPSGGSPAIDLPYAHAPASDSDRGCVGEFASAHLAGTAFWLGRDGSVFATSGREVSRATQPAQANLLSINERGEYHSLEEARLFGWQEFGHDMLAVRIPGNRTLVFDLTTGQWHQRGHEPANPWRVLGVVESGTRGQVIGWSEDNIFELVANYGKFDGIGNIPRSFTCPVVENNREDMLPREVEVLVQLSKADSNADGERVMTLRVSRDRGYSYSDDDTYAADIGGFTPAVFTGFAGASADFTFTFAYDGPGDLSIFGVYFDFLSNPDTPGQQQQ